MLLKPFPAQFYYNLGTLSNTGTILVNILRYWTVFPNHYGIEACEYREQYGTLRVKRQTCPPLQRTVTEGTLCTHKRKRWSDRGINQCFPQYVKVRVPRTFSHKIWESLGQIWESNVMILLMVTTTDTTDGHFIFFLSCHRRTVYVGGLGFHCSEQSIVDLSLNMTTCTTDHLNTSGIFLD